MTCPTERPKYWAAVTAAAAIAGFTLPASAETVRVRDIRVSESAGDTAVVISASARPTFTTWKLEQPARVVVELSGARLGDVSVPLEAGTYAVGLVSASVTEDESAGPRTRVVLTLRQAADYRVEAKGSDIVLKVVPRLRPPIAAAKTEADSGGEAQRNAEAKLREEARQRAAAEAKAEEKSRAETAARMEAERLRGELAQAQRETAKVRADAKAEERALVEAKAEEHSRAKAAAQREADRLRQELAQAQQAAAQVRVDAKAEERLRAQAKAQDSARAEAAAKQETDRLRDQLAQAQREAAQAKAAAEAATRENHRQKAALELAETRAQQAEAQTKLARQRAQAAEGETAAARGRESDRNHALRAAVLEVETRRNALDRMAREQREQQQQLDRAARLVGQREQAVRTSEANLAKLDKEARAARLRQERLARDASEQHKADAATALSLAERQRENAAKVTERSRLELARAVSARRQEGARKEEQSELRRVEEAKLAAAVALRQAEEQRLAGAQAERIRLEEERALLESERAKLENTRQALLADVQRMKSAPAAAPPTPRTASPTPAQTAVAAVPPPTRPLPKPLVATPPFIQVSQPVTAERRPERPRSITLRTPSQVRAIDFVDEPGRASVIIDVDARTTVSVERMAGRRLSLRLEHSELPESLERALDATEYLGPVKVISSYRDRALRGTVRVDVELAEDVPNRVRQEGHRIYWDFQKAQGKAPSLPAVLFVPARKVAGFVATAKEGLWLAQAVPPYLAPPVAAPTPTAAAPAAAPASAPEGRTGGGTRPSRASIGKKRYVGRRIDLDFKGADIHNILRLLADVGQVNVIVADDVRGDVTIKMRDVPWDQALDVVLRSKGLGSVREGNLLRVAPLPLLEKELEAEIARQKQIADVLPIETRLIGVSYAEAGNLQDKARDLLTPRGKISVDARTNTLIVSDVVKSLQLVEDLVRNLDTQTSQVVIEARIVEANSNFARQIGVQWGGNAFADTTHGNPTGLVFPYNVGIGGGADDGQAPLGGLVPAPRSGSGSSPNFLVNMPAAAGLGTGSAIGLTMGSVAGAFNLNLRLSAYESTGAVRILSSPRITTMDNIEATISQGVSIPVSTVSAMGAQTQFVDARLSLSVKPHVTNEGTIALVVNVTRNEPDFVNTGARGDPTIQRKEAKTSMLVRDGDTAVIGGIYTRNTGLSSARVPFFSDIPVLGWFFRNKKENDNRSEFLVFITPRIVNRARLAGQ